MSGSPMYEIELLDGLTQASVGLPFQQILILTTSPLCIASPSLRRRSATSTSLASTTLQQSRKSFLLLHGLLSVGSLTRSDPFGTGRGRAGPGPGARCQVTVYVMS